MPQIIPVVIGLAATLAASAGGAAGVAGIIAAGIGLGAGSFALVAGVIGTIVSTVASIAMSQLMKPKKAASAAAAGPQAESEARKQTIRGGIEARQVVYGRARVGGVIVYAASSGDKQEHLHLVVALAGHRCEAVESVILNDETIDIATQLSGIEVTGGRFAGKVLLRIHRGDQTEADGILLTQSPDGWGSDHILSGVTYLALRLTFDQDKFPSGLQSISAVVRGKNDIWDPRTGTSGYSANWALCVLDYLRGEHGLDCGGDELDLPYFVAAANLSDEGVQINDAGTAFQPRYTVNGAFKLDQAPMDIIERLLGSGAGTLVYVQGQYRLFGGSYSSPTVTLGVSDFAGEVQLETRAPRRELFNSVRGTFIDPARAWQAAEFPPLTDSGFIAEDGEQIWRDLPLDMVIDGTASQRLARIALKTARDSLRLKAPVRYAGVRLAVWQMVAVTLPDFGWNAKPFRIESWAFEPASGQVMLTLREENAANYAWYWDSGAFITPSPDTTLVDPLSIPAVTGVTVTPGTILQPDGGILPVIDITWTAAAHPFVTAHEVQWRLSGEDYVGQDVRMPGTRHTVRSVQAGQDYQVRVRAVAGLVRGPWSSGSVATSALDTTPPGVPTGLATTGLIRAVALRWTNPTAADFRNVEVHEGTTATGPWGKIGETPSDYFLRTGLAPSGSAWFRVRSIDRSGNASAWTSAVQGTASMLIATDITDGILNTAKFAASIAPVELLDSLSDSRLDGAVAFNKADGKLYKRVAGAWVPIVRAADFSGQLTAAQIASVDAATITGSITSAQVSSLDAAKLTGTVAEARLASIAATKVTGTLADSQIAAVAAAKVTGQLVNSQLADLDAAKLSGTIAEARLASIAASKVTGTLTNAQIADLAAAKITGQITTTQISDSGITTPKIATGAVVAGSIAAGAVTTAKLSVGSSNLIWNPWFADTRGWSVFPSSGATLSDGGALEVGNGWRLAPYGTLYLVSIPTLSVGQELYALLEAQSVVAGQRYQAAVLAQAQNSNCRIQINFNNAAGSYIGASSSANVSSNSGGGTLESQYTRLTALGDAPTGAATAHVFMIVTGIGSANAWGMFAKPLFGPAPPNATEVGPWEPGGVTQVSGGQIVARSVSADRIVANSLTAGEIAAGAITTSKLSVASANNAIWNPNCTISMDGWMFDGYTSGGSFHPANQIWPTNWGSPAYGSGAMYRPTMAAGEYIDAIWVGARRQGYAGVLPVSTGEWIEAQVRVSAHNLQPILHISWLDASGTFLSAAQTLGTTSNTGTGDGNLADKPFLWCKGQAPSGAKYCTFVLRGYTAVAQTTQSYIFWGMALLGRSVANSTEPMAWEPGGVTEIRGGVITARTINADRLIAASVTAAEIAAATIVAGNIATDAITATKIQAGAVETAKIATGAVTAGTIASGAVTTAKLSVASGNQIWNACGHGAAAGWDVSVDSGLTTDISTSITKAVSIGYGLSTYRLQGYETMVLRAVGAPNGPRMYFSWRGSEASWGNAIPVVADRKYQTSALFNVHRCIGHINVCWFDATGAYIGEYNSTTTTFTAGAGQVIGHYALVQALFVAPAGACFASPRFGALTDGQTQPYCLVTQTMFAEAPPNATEVGPWEPGGVTQISGGQLITRSIAADRIVAGAITAAELAAGAVTAGKIAAGSITATEIAANTVTTTNLVSNAITADKIAANAVTYGKVAAGAIRAAEIFAGELRAVHMAADTIIASTVQVADLIIGTEKISPAGVSSTSITAQGHSFFYIDANYSYGSTVLASVSTTVVSGNNGRLIITVDPQTAGVESLLVAYTGSGMSGGADATGGGSNGN